MEVKMSGTEYQLLRRFFPLVTVVLLFASVPLYSQIVTNGGFESSNTGVVDTTGWESGTRAVKGWLIQVASGINPPPVCRIVSDTVEQGDRALKVTVHGLGTNQWDIQVVADSLHVKPGATYNYSVWAKADKPGAQVNFTVGNYSFSEYKVIRPATLTTQWAKYTMQFTVSDGQSVIRAPIHFNYPADTNNAIYIDNLQIADVNADKEPVVVEAESGTLGSGLLVQGDSSNAYITPDSNYTGLVPGDTSRIATYQVTFPDSGYYDLFVRVQVGPAGYNSDSFFYGNGFGEKDDTASADWVFINGLAGAGFTDSSSVVDGPGTAGTGVWKWVNVTKNSYQGTPGDSFYVSGDSLTQTFQLASRESGLDIDRLAFGKSILYFTVGALDYGLPGTTKNPTDSSLFYKGPPIAEGQGKFLGCAYGDVPDNVFANYWTQLTPGNAGKWGSVASPQDTTKWNWSGLDYAYNYAMTHHEVFKDHNLIWGNQQPSWISNLDSAQQIRYITTWFRMVGERYPNIDMVDVVNEPLPGHNPPDGKNGHANYEGALGGTGSTGYDWVINAFALARQYLPNAKLLINDYGIINDNSATTQYLQIINLLKSRGLIDGIGVQCHRFEIESSDTNVLESNLAKLGDTGLPVYISEMDLGNTGNGGTPNDNMQLQLYQKYFPVLWNNPAVKGITLWGYLQGQMWQTTCYLVNSDGSSRPALTWLTQYIKDHPTNIENVGSVLPTVFRLDQNYPNPFNPSTKIRFEVPRSGFVSLEVYDVLGRLVVTLVKGVRMPGAYEASFDGSRYASGVYFYRFTAPGVEMVKKMLMIK